MVKKNYTLSLEMETVTRAKIAAANGNFSNYINELIEKDINGVIIPTKPRSRVSGSKF